MVVAGHSREFHLVAQEKIAEAPEGTTWVYKKNVARLDIDNKSYRLASMPDQLRGVRGVQVEFWGSWLSIPTARLREFMDLAQLARLP